MNYPLSHWRAVSAFNQNLASATLDKVRFLDFCFLLFVDLGAIPVNFGPISSKKPRATSMLLIWIPELLSPPVQGWLLDLFSLNL